MLKNFEIKSVIICVIVSQIGCAVTHQQLRPMRVNNVPNRKRSTCPSLGDLSRDRDAHAPVIATPHTLYVNEAHRVWISPGDRHHSNEINLQFYFVDDEGYIPQSECYTLTVSGVFSTHDAHLKDYTTFLDITLSEDTVQMARSDNISLVSKWRHSADDFWREHNKQVNVVQDSTVVFIQTNKAVFNPRQTVEITIYTVNQELKPRSVAMEVDIVGPTGVIHQRTAIASQNQADYPRVNRLEFQFPPLALMGPWTIRARYGRDMTSFKDLNITLDNYKLPTFRVAVDTVDMKVIDDMARPGSIHATVTATHVSGAAVHGKVKCSASYVMTSQARERTGIEFKTWKKNLTQDESVQFDVPLELLQLPSLSSNLDSIVLHLQCAVTECLSGITEYESSETILKDKVYSLSFEGSEPLFKPGLPFFLQAKLVNVKGDGVDNTSCNITTKDCSTRRVLGTPTIVVSNQDGKIFATLEMPEQIETICIEISVPSLDMEQHYKITTEPSESRQYLSIVPEQTEMGQFSQFLVNASHPVNITSLYAMHIMQGAIHEQQKHTPVIFTNPFRVRFNAIANSAPRAHLVVFYFTEFDGETIIVSDSLTIEVERVCSPVEFVETDKAVYSPKELMDLTLHAYPFSTVVSQAVDISILQLGNSGVLSPHILQEVLEQTHSGIGRTSATLLNDFLLTPNQNPATPDPIENNVELETIEDCCVWGQTQEWNAETSPCTNVVLKQELLQSKNFSKDCMKEALACCTDTHEQSGEVGISDYYYDGDILIDDNPYSPSGSIGHDREDDHAEDVFNPITLEQRHTSTDFDDLLRHNFQETIVFPVQYNRYQTTVFEQTLPDSLTSWQIQTVFLNNISGMCVAPPTTVQVRKEMFIRVELPSRVVYGEHFEITAVIYNNYQSPTLEGLIRLEDVSDDLCHDRRNVSAEYSVRVALNEKRVVYWVLIPEETGAHDVTVKLTTLDGSLIDAVKQSLYVEKAGFDFRQRTDIAVLRSEVPYSVILEPPEEVPEGSSINAVIQFHGNLMEPNSELVGLIEKDSLYTSPDTLLVQVASLLYTLQYMGTVETAQQADTHVVTAELSLAVDNLITFQDPVVGCFQLSLQNPVCDIRLTTFAANILADMIGYNQHFARYFNHACSALFYSFVSMEQTGSITQRSCLYKTMATINCHNEERVQDYIGNNIMAESWTGCGDPVEGFKSLLKVSGEEHLNGLNDLMELWREQFNDEERHQKIQLKMTEVNTEDIEDASWLLYSAAHGNSTEIADTLATWMLMHRDPYGTFVTYSDTVLALMALREYVTMTSTNSAGSDAYATCTVAWDSDDTDTMVTHQIDLIDPTVTQSIDVSSTMHKNLSVACTGGLTFAQTYVSYHILTGESSCPLHLNVTVATHTKPRGRRRGKRATHCDYDPKDSRRRTHAYRVHICFNGLDTLRQNSTIQSSNADLTVSLFSGYSPASRYINNQDNIYNNWVYIPSKSSLKLQVHVPQVGDEVCVDVLKNAVRRVSNIQPGLVVVKLQEYGVHCSVLYHTSDDHPLVDRPTSC